MKTSIPSNDAALTAPNTAKQIDDLQRSLRDLQERRTAANKIAQRDPVARDLIARFDGEIAAVLARLRELRPPTPGEVLAELATKIATTETELRQLSERRSAAIQAKLKREPGAEERLQQIAEQVDAAEGRLITLQQQLGQLQQQIAAERGADYTRAAEAKPGRLAELHHERVALAETVTRAAHALVTALRGIDANGDALAVLLDDQGARNFLSMPALRRRANNALARAFAINPNAPLTVGNSLFGLASDAIGAAAHQSLTDWEQQGLDDLAPFYSTAGEAEEARHRLEQRNCPTIAVPVHGVFTLVRFEHVFGDEASAGRAAMRSATPMAVVPHDGGFVLLPVHFSGRAA